jgi:hypothetical protein
MIKSETDLAHVVNEINERLQAVHDYLGEKNDDQARIRFPRGYLRTCAHHRSKYDFLNDKILQSNIAYAKLTTDIFRWMLNRTDLSLTAKEMLIKQGISIIGGVAEAIIKTVLKGQPGGGNKQNFKKKTEKLYQSGKISQEIQKELEWLWDTRNDVHLMLLEKREYNKYSIKQYNRAVLVLQELRVALGGNP